MTNSNISKFSRLVMGVAAAAMIAASCGTDEPDVAEPVEPVPVETTIAPTTAPAPTADVEEPGVTEDAVPTVEADEPATTTTAAEVPNTEDAVAEETPSDASEEEPAQELVPHSDPVSESDQPCPEGEHRHSTGEACHLDYGHEPEPSAGIGAPDDVAYRALVFLAGELGVPYSELALLGSAERVTWADGSLGCPKPGFAYTQAMVPGYRFTFLHGTDADAPSHDVHTDEQGTFFVRPVGCYDSAEPEPSETTPTSVPVYVPPDDEEDPEPTTTTVAPEPTTTTEPPVTTLPETEAIRAVLVDLDGLFGRALALWDSDDAASACSLIVNAHAFVDMLLATFGESALSEATDWAGWMELLDAWDAACADVEPSYEWTPPQAGMVPEVWPLCGDDRETWTWRCTPPAEWQRGDGTVNPGGRPDDLPRAADQVQSWAIWCYDWPNVSCAALLFHMSQALDYLGAHRSCVLNAYTDRVEYLSPRGSGADVDYARNTFGWHLCSTVIDPLVKDLPAERPENDVGYRLSDTGISLAERCRVVLTTPFPDIELEGRGNDYIQPRRFGQDCDAWAAYVEGRRGYTAFPHCEASHRLAEEWMEHVHGQHERYFAPYC